MQARKPYPSDVSDQQWKIIGPLIPAPKSGGAPTKFARREVLNGILYVLRTGCAWRELPHDLPPWDTVHGYFRRWTREGLWEWIGDRLRDQARPRAGKKKPRPRPSSTARASKPPGKAAVRLRRQQEDQRAQKAPADRHPRLAAGRGDHRRQRAGSRRRQAAAAPGQTPLWPPRQDLGPTRVTPASLCRGSNNCGRTANCIWKSCAAPSPPRGLSSNPAAGSSNAALPG